MINHDETCGGRGNEPERSLSEFSSQGNALTMARANSLLLNKRGENENSLKKGNFC